MTNAKNTDNGKRGMHLVNTESNTGASKLESGLADVEEIIEDLRQGRMVILMDDEDRENEGDLILIAEKATPEHINFMARYARGLICLTLTPDRCEQLRLPLMVERNRTPYATNFTVSIEAAVGVTTGISAADRARTVLAAVAPDAQATDIVQPGHIFPLMAQPGGVLRRAGHTEAGCDLARLAGCEPAAVIVEIMNEDGSMARRADLEVFAREHDLRIGTIADLIAYRAMKEKTVVCVRQQAVQTEYGTFQLHVYHDEIQDHLHAALVLGDVRGEDAALVRVHVQNTLRDTWHIQAGRGSGWTTGRALARIAEEGCGVLVWISNAESPDEVLADLTGSEPEPRIDMKGYRMVGTGSQMLQDLGVRRMRLLSSPIKFKAISGFELEVVEYLEWKE